MRDDCLVEVGACCDGATVSWAKARVSVSFPSKFKLRGLLFIRVFIPSHSLLGF
jgi:hypothetical protein